MTVNNVTSLPTVTEEGHISINERWWTAQKETSLAFGAATVVRITKKGLSCQQVNPLEANPTRRTRPIIFSS